MGNNACKNIKNLSASAGNLDLEAIKTQNEILKYVYESISQFIQNKV